MINVDDILNIATQDSLEEVKPDEERSDTVVIFIRDVKIFNTSFQPEIRRMLSMHPTLKLVNVEEGLKQYYYEIERLQTLNDVSLLLSMITNKSFSNNSMEFCVQDFKDEKPNVRINLEILRVLFAKVDTPVSSTIIYGDSNTSIERLVRLYKSLCGKPVTSKDVEKELIRFQWLKVIMFWIASAKSCYIARVFRTFKKTDKPIYKELDVNDFSQMTDKGLSEPMRTTTVKKRYVFIKEATVFRANDGSFVSLYYIMRVMDKSGQNYYVTKRGPIVKNNGIFPVKIKVSEKFISIIEKYGVVNKDYKRKELIKKIFK